MDKSGTSKTSKKRLLKTKRRLTEAELNSLAEHWFSESESENDSFDSDDQVYSPMSLSDADDESADDTSSIEAPVEHHADEHTANTPSTSSVPDAWSDVTGLNQQSFTFTCQSGINLPGRKNSYSPLECFELFVDNDILEMITLETNRNVEQVVDGQRLSRQSRLLQWTETSVAEMKKFLGLMIWMGLNKKPSIRDYWSTNILYRNSVANQIMSRNRYELLLRFWHFSDNRRQIVGNKLHKIAPLLEKLVSNFKKYRVPGSMIVVDETMVPFRGRLGFRQYIPGKRHKYGIKLFKLCCADSYTYNIEIYQGKTDHSGVNSLSKTVVLELCQDYLNEGRTIVTDNFYTSLELATDLLKKKTHLVGTIRKNRKGLPKNVVTARLKKGEIIGKENNTGIVVMKWKDQRDVLALSTYHNLDIVPTGKRNRKNVEISKPKLILDYNKGKSGIDLSDQMASYSTPIRKSIRWYHKVACELLLGTAVVNAYIVYKALSGANLGIVQFREALCTSLLNLDASTVLTPQSVLTPLNSNKRKHEFGNTELTDNRDRKVRRRCVHCYEKLRKEGKNFKEARDTTKRVITVCTLCDNRPSVCLNCFNTVHVNL